MDASTLAIQFINGIQFGVLIAVLATGLSLIFGMLGIINFAHGSFYVLGIYITWLIYSAIGKPWSYWIASIISLPILGLFAGLVDRLLLRPVSKQPIVYQLLLTFGLLLVIQQGVAMTFGAMPITFQIPPPFGGDVNLGFFSYPKYRLFTVFAGLGIIGIISLIIDKTRVGRVIRATAEDPETAKTLGVNTNLVYTLTFAVGSMLAGLGGVLHAPLLGTVQPYIGSEILIICFIAVVLGGMDSIRGVLLGGILLGVVRGTAALVWAPISDFIMFATMGIVLMVRPQGILGKKDIS